MSAPRSKQVVEAVAAAKAVRDRVRRDYDPSVVRARRQARRDRLGRRLRRFAVLALGGLAALLAFSLIWSLIIEPIGIVGLALVMMLGAVMMIGAGVFSGERRVRADSITSAKSLPQVAARADEFLYQQRRALPAPAQDLTDLIAQRLTSMGPQLEALNPATPEAHELQRLIGEELPDLVTRYRAVPPHLRGEDRNGRVPETELIEGLRLVDGKIDAVQRDIAAADMDRLSSHKRYLEVRYSGDGPESPS
jgi:hypothetical protein